MAAVATILNHHIAAASQAFTGKSASPASSSTNETNNTDSSSDASNSGATISANDFLTLLVTEMQNQDPTADTDPNEYIDQLVQVNSLEQLIDINQTLSTAVEGTAASSSNGATGKTVGAAGNPDELGTASDAGAVHGMASKASVLPITEGASTAANTKSLESPLAQHTAGNLSVPGVNRAAQRVGHALDGRTRAQPPAGSR